jgi:hypothetical protein
VLIEKMTPIKTQARSKMKRRFTTCIKFLNYSVFSNHSLLQIIIHLIAGDTALSKLAVLSQLEKAIGSVSDGINQIIFVTRGRFTAEEANVFDIVQNTLFDGLFMCLC